MEIRAMAQEEQKYTYRQSMQIQGQTGSIGYLRGDFGSRGNEFHTTCVGRILRTFKIKKNVEVTDNGKIII